MIVSGTVKWFSTIKGWGFITADQPGSWHGDPIGDVFVHYSNIKSEEQFKNLSEGDPVRFELADNGRGPTALNVELLRW